MRHGDSPDEMEWLCWTIRSCGRGGPTMPDPAWEVFIRCDLGGRPLTGQPNRVHSDNHRYFSGAGMNFPSLFSPLKMGPFHRGHLPVMAPLTRMRAEKPGLAPRPLNTEYYAQ